MQVRVGRKVLGEEDPTHTEVKGKAPHIALPMHLLVEQVTKCGANVLYAVKSKFPVSVEGDRVCVVVVSGPFDDGRALPVMRMCVCHNSSISNNTPAG